MPHRPRRRPPSPRTTEVRGSSGFAVWGLVLLVAVALIGVVRCGHACSGSSTRRELNAAAARIVDGTAAGLRRDGPPAPPTTELTLPGNAQPYRGAALYARINGYLIRWLVDIGDRVKQGQLLAEISTPDVDDQLAQARANLVLAKSNLQAAEANLVLAKITLKRNLDANRSSAGAVSQLTIDQNRAEVKTTAAQVETARASIQVNEATVQQYADLQAFQKIVAPFPGVITARTVDPGALVAADNPSETRPLFYLMQTDPLRVFVNVPQVYSTTLAVGQHADVYREEDPNRQFSGPDHAHGQRSGPQHAHAVDRDRRAQPARRPAAGHVPAGEVHRPAGRGHGADSQRGAAVASRRDDRPVAGRRPSGALPQGRGRPRFRRGD